MDDRYLFKAKRIDNGEWIVGNLIQTPFMGTVRSWISSESEDKERLRSIATYKAEWRSIEVLTDSICQCTGLEDKHGTLIWENDLVLTPREDGYSLICWNDTEARWEMHNEAEGIVLDFDNYWANEIEVVGNRFDNPELLEVERWTESKN